MENASLTISAEGGVRIITMRRPEQLNAIDEALHSALAEVWDEIAADSAARVVVITGEGRAFSAGGDLSFISAQLDDPDLRARTFQQARRIIHSMAGFPLPVIAVVNGAAIGLGASIAVLSDLVVMAESAYLQDPHLGVGLVVGDGGMVWPLSVGLHRAKQALLLGERIGAERAVAWGIANEVLETTELMPRAMQMARRIEGLPAAATQASKLALNGYLREWLDGPFEQALQAEITSMETEEHRAIMARMIAQQKG